MRIAGLTGIVVGAALALAPNQAEACSCGTSGTVQEALQASDAVFTGKVIKIDDSSYQKLGGEIQRAKQVRFTIVDSWKGPRDGEVQVFTNAESASCGYPFDAAPAHLVFAEKKDDGKLWASLCSRTKALSPDRHPVEREELRLDLEALNQLVPGGRGRGCAGCNAGDSPALLLGLLAMVGLLLRPRRR